MTRKQLVQRALIGMALVFPLAACGGGGGGKDTVIEPPKVVTTRQEDLFGTQFGIDFRASADSEPAAVADNDIVPVSLTTEPIPIQP